MGHVGNWDPAVRAKELDREGIAGEVVFCDGSQKNYPPFGAGFALRGISERSIPELRMAGCRAHNRWLAEFCQTNKGRHAGIAMVTMDDIEETVAEIRWARKMDCLEEYYFLHCNSPRMAPSHFGITNVLSRDGKCAKNWRCRLIRMQRTEGFHTVMAHHWYQWARRLGQRIVRIGSCFGGVFLKGTQNCNSVLLNPEGCRYFGSTRTLMSMLQSIAGQNGLRKRFL